VSDYLYYFPAEYGITVRQLLNHSAGLGERTESIYVNLRLDGQPLPDPDLFAKEYLEGLSEPMFEPGSASAYSNTGFVMVGQIVAVPGGRLGHRAHEQCFGLGPRQGGGRCGQRGVLDDGSIRHWRNVKT
jgi:hypothetical protein